MHSQLRSNRDRYFTASSLEQRRNYRINYRKYSIFIYIEYIVVRFGILNGLCELMLTHSNSARQLVLKYKVLS